MGETKNNYILSNGFHAACVPCFGCRQAAIGTSVVLWHGYHAECRPTYIYRQFDMTDAAGVNIGGDVVQYPITRGD